MGVDTVIGFAVALYTVKVYRFYQADSSGVLSFSYFHCAFLCMRLRICTLCL